MKNKIIFLTEMGFTGKIPDTHENMRTEFAWMNVLDAEHRPLIDYNNVSGYELVIIIWPKGKAYLNSEGLTMKSDEKNVLEKYLDIDIVGILKGKNKKVAYMQEGPAWFFNDYTIPQQFNYYNQIAESDIIFCHNKKDVSWYKGLFLNKDVRVMQSLMIDKLIKDIKWNPEDKVIIGGNFCRWYGGFQSYLISNEFAAEKWIPSMHNKREFEDQIDDLNHLPYMNWIEWMKALSTFRYAVHLMPTSAAGTFSLNCAYFGIPCIGNKNLDTQRQCFPQLAVDVEDIESARKLAIRLRDDKAFYNTCSQDAKSNFSNFFNVSSFKEKINNENN
jgi:hypothetical protein